MNMLKKIHVSVAGNGGKNQATIEGVRGTAAGDLGATKEIPHISRWCGGENFVKNSRADSGNDFN